MDTCMHEESTITPTNGIKHVLYLEETHANTLRWEGPLNS